MRISTTNPLHANTYASSMTPQAPPLSSLKPEPSPVAALLSPATIRKAMVAGYMLIALYTCFVGTFLAVFVPQLCGNAECTFEQNVYVDLSPYNVAALLLNLATFLALLLGFIVEFRRERWIINNLDVDPALPENNLNTELCLTTADDAPGTNGWPADGLGGPNHQHKLELRRTLYEYNKHYKKLYEWIAGLTVANVVVSGVLVFYYYFKDVRLRARLPPPRPPSSSRAPYFAHYQHPSPWPSTAP